MKLFKIHFVFQQIENGFFHWIWPMFWNETFDDFVHFALKKTRILCDWTGHLVYFSIPQSQEIVFVFAVWPPQTAYREL